MRKDYLISAVSLNRCSGIGYVNTGSVQRDGERITQSHNIRRRNRYSARAKAAH